MPLLLFFVLLLSGCSTLLSGRPPGPWYQAYEPIEDADSAAFIEAAFAAAQEEFGVPVIPVNKILLRRSRRTGEARRYRIGEDFSLTECVDRTNGVFVIYMGVDPDHDNYYALLGHECVHLLNPYVTDWYMEGLATLFSEQFCELQGHEWGSWKRHFEKSRREPYALSYRMMKELKNAFPERYSDLYCCTKPHDSAKSFWQEIDIDRWIALLPPARRQEAVEIIRPYAEVLFQHTDRIYGFNIPSEP